MRDEFADSVKRVLADRVNYCCSNPDCRAQTTGPQDDSAKAVNLGVAAHITAAAAGGPRFDPALSAEDRRHPDNGVWLCQNCAKLVDNDVAQFTGELLRAWKTIAEHRARKSLGRTTHEGSAQAPASPQLDLYLEPDGIRGSDYAPRVPARWFVLGLANVGSGIAKYPGIHCARASGLTISIFGMDGNHNFGLPQRTADSEWFMFQGGADDVIHPGSTLKIAKLTQPGDDKGIDMATLPLRSCWVFPAFSFSCEICCEGNPIIRVEKRLPEELSHWPWSATQVAT